MTRPMTSNTRLPGSLLTFAAPVLVLACLGVFGSGAIAQNQPPPKFAALFNGKDLAGWRGGNTFDPAKLAAMPEGAN
jgi:hypothetical protein